MASETAQSPVSLKSGEATRQPESLSRRALNRFLRHRAAVTGTLILTGIILFILGGSLFYTEAYANVTDTSKRLTAPNLEHPFGTDDIGRDILARVIYGGQISLMIGFLAVTVSVTVGVTIGLISGYYGGLLDSILMRITEMMLSIPTLLLLLTMANIFGGRVPNINVFGRTLSGSVVVIVLIIGATSWMYLARIVRSTVLSLKETEYVLAARALGATNRRIIIQHILPNTLAPVVVAATLGVATAILQEAYISFLGVGVSAPTATWGNILNKSRQYIETAPWLWIAPGTLIVLTVMSINYVGDGLRDAFDPRSDK